MRLDEVLEFNRKIKFPKSEKKFKIGIISNITINIFKYFIEYELKKKGLNAEVYIGDYNNLVQNAYKYKNFDTVIIFHELLNISESFEKYKATNDLDKIKKFFLKDLKTSFNILQNCPLVLVNDFNYLSLRSNLKTSVKFEKICKNLNKFISRKNKNIHVVKISKFFKTFGIKKYTDKKNYKISKTLYNSKFMLEYAKKISFSILAQSGKSKKAIVLDCDNTLWNGVIGENKENKEKNWKVFKQIQFIFKRLKKKGFILCLCSKNNFKDVNNFFKKKNMPLKFRDFTVKKINWNDKVKNIKEISKELNIDLNSFIFVDDSSFEIGAVEKYLKGVDCIKVPSNINDYLFKIEDLENNLPTFTQTKEDKIRAKSYDQEKKRLLDKKNFENIDEYIKSLNIKTIFKQGNKISTNRAYQLCQRTNQFNLTTKRYNENQIKKFVKNKDVLISTISLKDNYGDYGITGLSIVFINRKTTIATIDTFILSCRIIGRGVEKEYLDWIIKSLKKMNISKIYSVYIKSEKNEIVRNFYDLNKFKIISSTSKKKDYLKNI